MATLRSWAIGIDHPHDAVASCLRVTEKWREACEYEATATAAEIDRHREGVLSHIEDMGVALEGARLKWLNEDVAPHLRTLNRKLHGPLLAHILQMLNWPDRALMHRITTGFQYVGNMDKIETGAISRRQKAKISVDELRSQRGSRNSEVLAKIRATEYPKEIEDAIKTDVAEGAMNGPFLMEDGDELSKSLTRRLPVLQFREDGSPKLRIVDHSTESGAKEATESNESAGVQGLDVFIEIGVSLLSKGHRVRMSKRDVSRAFRKCGLCKDHLDLVWVVHRDDWNQLCIAQHLAAMFGAQSSVASWHRIAEVLSASVVELCKAAIMRWVDDFGAMSREDIKNTATRCLDRICKAVGIDLGGQE
jgi:hypothetical protein